jgi:hypothetical protein
MANQMADLDAAYLAGFIDGEGSIMIVPRFTTFSTTLQASNTNRNVLDWIASTTGVGGVFAGRKASGPNRATWQWICHGDGAETVLRQIRPHIKVKAEQADLAIDTQSRLRVPALKADRTWQAEYRAKMQQMNRRGPREIEVSP